MESGKKKDILIDYFKTKLDGEKSVYIWEIVEFDSICLPDIEPHHAESSDFEEKFRYRSLLDLNYLLSPTFYRGKTINQPSSWNIKLKKNSDNALSLAICLDTLENGLDQTGRLRDCALIRFSFSILNRRGEVVFPKVTKKVLDVIAIETKEEVVESFISLPELYSLSENYLGGNSLRLKLDLQIIKGVEEDEIVVGETVRLNGNHAEEYKGSGEFATSVLKNLWVTKMHADVALTCETASFPAHKNILCARSPVFTAMFSNEMVEQLSGKVVITDLDSHTLEELLRFIYTGSLSLSSGEHSSSSSEFTIVTSLLYGAEKYEIANLKQKCWDIICDKFLCQTYIAKILLLLEQYEPGEEVKQDIYSYCNQHWALLMGCEDIKELAIVQPATFLKLVLHKPQP